MQRLTNASFGCLFLCFMKPSKPCTLAFCVSWEPAFAICLLVYWSMQRRSISFWGRHEYTSFSVAINGILVLVGTVSLFRVGCCTVYTTNNSQEFLRHYFSFRNHSFARGNQIDSCFLISYKSPLIWLGRGIRIRMGIVQYCTKTNSLLRYIPVLGDHSLFHSHFWLVSVYSLFLSVSHVRTTYRRTSTRKNSKFTSPVAELKDQ